MARTPRAVQTIADPGTKELVERAVAASFTAYAPYSKFRVGAALRTTRGTYAASNVENGSFGLTSCAERNAVFAAVSTEGGSIDIEAVAVYASSPNRKIRTASPCGACRQVLAEFGRGAHITFLDDGAFRTMTVDELLPVAFELL